MLKFRKPIRKEPVIGVSIVVLLIAFIVWRILSAISYHNNHSIADTNGADDFSLVSLTLENILDDWYGYTMFSSGTGKEGNTTNVDFEWEDEDYDRRSMHAQSFSGVAVLQATKIESDRLVLDITSTVESGNFRIVVMVDGAYYCDADINQTAQVALEDIAGKTVLVKIAGESAAFHAEVERTY